MKKDVYKEHGYKDRRDYLYTIAEENGLDPHAVHCLADLLGQEEDFDGLVVACEDAGSIYE